MNVLWGDPCKRANRLLIVVRLAILRRLTLKSKPLMSSYEAPPPEPALFLCLVACRDDSTTYHLTPHNNIALRASRQPLGGCKEAIFYDFKEKRAACAEVAYKTISKCEAFDSVGSSSNTAHSSDASSRITYSTGLDMQNTCRCTAHRLVCC